jgi:hypothetical protein
MTRSCFLVELTVGENPIWVHPVIAKRIYLENRLNNGVVNLECFDLMSIIRIQVKLDACCCLSADKDGEVDDPTYNIVIDFIYAIAEVIQGRWLCAG